MTAEEKLSRKDLSHEELRAERRSTLLALNLLVKNHPNLCDF